MNESQREQAKLARSTARRVNINMIDDFEIDPNWAMTNAKTQTIFGIFIHHSWRILMLMRARLQSYLSQIHGRSDNGNGIESKLGGGVRLVADIPMSGRGSESQRHSVVPFVTLTTSRCSYYVASLDSFQMKSICIFYKM